MASSRKVLTASIYFTHMLSPRQFHHYFCGHSVVTDLIYVRDPAIESLWIDCSKSLSSFI